MQENTQWAASAAKCEYTSKNLYTSSSAAKHVSRRQAQEKHNYGKRSAKRVKMHNGQ